MSSLKEDTILSTTLLKILFLIMFPLATPLWYYPENYAFLIALIVFPLLKCLNAYRSSFPASMLHYFLVLR